jgi:GTP-binding protein
MNNTPEPVKAPAHAVVAIVGRPNVGKSALFNRILGRRLAIVHEACGVTRDRLIAHAEWNGKSFELVDTGGLSEFDRTITPNQIDAETRHQSEIAIEDASVTILVVDVESGVVPLDEEVARLMHRKGIRTIIAINKCDNPDRDTLTEPFQRLGFPVFGVSALHNRGVSELMDAVCTPLPTTSLIAQPDLIKVTVVGRPNVGKSSFINRLIRRERMIVSDVPGTTRDSIDVPFSVGSGPSARNYLLTDTAGLRRMGKVDNAVERFSIFRAERSIDRADVVILMLDATQGPTSQDKTIANTVIAERKGCVVIVNKWDLMGHSTQTKYREALAHTVPFLSWVPIVFVSAKDGYNMRQSLDTIDLVASQVQTQLPTGLLNRTIMNAFERVQPPVIKGKRFKIYYATQLGAKPIRLGLFVNDPKRLTDTYSEYLIHALRRQFGLEGAPIQLVLKERPRAEFVAKASPRRHRQRPRS